MGSIVTEPEQISFSFTGKPPSDAAPPNNPPEANPAPNPLAESKKGDDGSPPLAVTTEHGRYYQKPGSQRKYPSVTTLIHQVYVPALEKWRIKQSLDFVIKHPDVVSRLAKADPNNTREFLLQKAYTNTTAADAGTRVHAYGEALARESDLPEFLPEDEPRIRAISEFVSGRCKQFLEIEATVFSHKYGYAGTVDAIIVDQQDDQVCMLDYKTGRIYNSVALQLAALLNADEIVEPDGSSRPIPKCSKAMAVQLCPNGSYKCYTARTTEQVFKKFLALKEIHGINDEMWVKFARG